METQRLDSTVNDGVAIPLAFEQRTPASLSPTTEMNHRFRLVVFCSAAIAAVWFVYISMSAFTPAAPQTRLLSVKYILQWTPRFSPFNLIKEGSAGFHSKNCAYTNCFVTADKNFLPHLTDFDAIAISGKELTKRIELPNQRAEHQKYIFAATESADYYPVCDSVYDNYFNWTWTYKINSDFRWGYIKIYDLDGRLVGPKKDMQWPTLAPIGDELKRKLDGKSKFAAWFVSNCNTLSKREMFYKLMENESKVLNYNLTVDVYGNCEKLKCPRDKEEDCYKLVEDDYYFYLSFENSFAEDYVTEKLLTALNHYAIPVVYGAANYSRFLPPGSYLNALELGARNLLERMNEIYNDKEKFYDFFRWRNHYRYEHSLGKDVCDLCAALNNEEMMKPHTHTNLRKWWNDARWDDKNNRCS
ncbi:unnamed protein product [Chilo suppressalis]|uniref:Fucosyltransferase n=1 Tax=Chilo suppressalis TaxID=168631 RepID=A0ABN8L4Z8_CHISP|nr:unnamed protein product [Chilo suppressalis]